jgi:DNA modification methylase
MKITTKNKAAIQFNKIKETKSWDSKSRDELRMHKIHVYPAKFPSFLISKSLEYANKNGIKIDSIGDVFCGCGTTALEAKRNNKSFWGCDINPVATLITKVKTDKYDSERLQEYYNKIVSKFSTSKFAIPNKIMANERIKFWFENSQIEKLYRLQRAIKSSVPQGNYQDFFLVAFSNILKGSSKWLTKSIKPTIDKNKVIKDIDKLFRIQFSAMFKAVNESNEIIQENSSTTIVNENFLNINVTQPFLDLVITSPPYVTSYEYADLHQLSTLWLGYTNDFRTFRNGTIGSVYHKTLLDEEINKLSPVGKEIFNNLVKAKKSKAKSIAKYFIDIKASVDKSFSIINPGGLAIFVIGNTKYKNVYVDNAKYITECMFDSGFSEIDVFKRKISYKILSPYRNKDGKFSNDKRKRKVYSYEFVLIAKK